MGEISYLVGQIFGIITVILGFINYQMKTREEVLFVHIATAFCFSFHYMLTGAYSGMAMNLVAIVRNIVYFFVGKNGKVSRWWAIAFAVIMGVMGIIAWEDWYSVFIVTGIVLNSYAMSFSNPNNVRKSILITSPMVLTYDVFVSSYGGMVYESVVIISSMIGIIRFDSKKNSRVSD